eukprot:1693359-Prymnesium_polylepis.1
MRCGPPGQSLTIPFSHTSHAVADNNQYTAELENGSRLAWQTPTHGEKASLSPDPPVGRGVALHQKSSCPVSDERFYVRKEELQQ